MAPAQELVKRAELQAGDCLTGLPEDFKTVLVAAVLIDVAPKGALALVTSPSYRRGTLVVLAKAAPGGRPSGQSSKRRPRVCPATHA